MVGRGAMVAFNHLGAAVAVQQFSKYDRPSGRVSAMNGPNYFNV